MILLLLCFAPSLVAEQLHLSIAGPHSQNIALSYISNQATDSIAFYGTSSQALVQNATGSSSQYQFNSYQSGFIHSIVLTNLVPETTYFYTCANHSGTFQSPLNPTTQNVEFGIVGDVGQTNYSVETLGYLEKYENLAAVLHAGDLAYADFNQTRWDTWGRLIQPLASRLPWMVAPGNHEIEPTHHLKPFVAYQARFRMPHAESGSDGGNLYYSFNVGIVHVVILTPYSSTGSKSAQYLWAEQDLKQINRIRTPWVIVMMHAPWYNSNKAHQSSLEPQWLMKRNMEDLLYKYRVDLVLSGHVHAYERTHRVYKGKVDQNGPYYITIGDAGNREGIAKAFLQPQPDWSAFRRARYGYGYLNVVNLTHAKFQWHEDEANAIHAIDSMWLLKKVSLQSPASTSELLTVS